MIELDTDLEKTTTLQAVRQAIRSRNLRRLNEAFQRNWAKQILRESQDQKLFSGEYKVFRLALESMNKEERLRAFQWTWDCYHPLMSDLGKCLQDMDGFLKN
ncbi:hypothetical protein [Acanthopleuribacter pedis]|uniref:Uncharacterized protein n=1 Tax=Acanthopleuribacter pedis TaxID=442870 RepID=A0A8J7QH57_9BACT|nr:hypothetical protein [Acanthopleuribacter pedis]MBO1322305.1 hypothetical protein [Acanthopleuribacter pedis]